MPDEIPTGEKAVYLIFEMIALGFFLGAVDAFMRGDALWKWAGAIVAGIAFMVVGVKVPRIRAWLGTGSATSKGGIYPLMTILAIAAVVLLAGAGIVIYRHFYPAIKVANAQQSVASAKPEIRLTQAEIGWLDQQERIELGPTSKAPPGKLWIANVHYSPLFTGDIAIPYESSFVGIAPGGVMERERQEDMVWDHMTSMAKYYKEQLHVSAGTNLLTSFKGPVIPEAPLKCLREHRCALYFAAMFEHKDDSGAQVPLYGVCLYREGDSEAVHVCHEHNGPI